MREHEHRRQLIEEMHLRRWPALQVPGAVIQIVRIVAANERDEERAMLGRIPGISSGELSPNVRHVSGTLSGDMNFAWERHTEGSSIALFASRGHADTDIAAAREWMEGLPGRVVRATRITLVETEDQATDILPSMDFRSGEMVSCRIRGGIRIWSDFRLHDAGYGRMLVASGGSDPVTLSRVVQQLQELGNYRNMALLGLPEVREQWTDLDAIEERLRQFALDVSDAEISDDSLLDNVSELSGELATLRNRIGYRLDATKAYATLVKERLDDLEPSPIASFHSLADFTRRRFLPAIRTCNAHRERLDQLSLRASDLTSLLRARISTRIENQNARLLESMERRAAVQLRLQQLVEGLSILALAYYGIGLLAYVLGAVETIWPIESPALIKGIAVPVFMLAIWLAVRRYKSRIMAED